jgi:hypothetical protein
VIGYEYYVVFIDDFSHYTWFYPLHNKSNVYKTFVKFKLMAENQFSSTIKQLQSDGGREYTSLHFQSLLTKYGNVHRKSCPLPNKMDLLIENFVISLKPALHFWLTPICPNPTRWMPSLQQFTSLTGPLHPLLNICHHILNFSKRNLTIRPFVYLVVSLSLYFDPMATTNMTIAPSRVFFSAIIMQVTSAWILFLTKCTCLTMLSLTKLHSLPRIKLLHHYHPS